MPSICFPVKQKKMKISRKYYLILKETNPD